MSTHFIESGVIGIDLVAFSYWLYDSDILQCASPLLPKCFMLLIKEMYFRPDPNGNIAFMVDALQAAEDPGDRAWIIGHIPLGKEDTLIDQVRCVFSTSLFYLFFPTKFN